MVLASGFLASSSEANERGPTAVIPIDTAVIVMPAATIPSTAGFRRSSEPVRGVAVALPMVHPFRCREMRKTGQPIL